MALLLQLYGEHLFRVGATLSSYRHLIAYAQRTFPDFRRRSRVCWELVTRWEALEPLAHRPPLPSKLCEALASLAIAWKWPRIALVLLLSFHGILRIGETLAVLRRDLVLPAEA